MTDLLTDWWRQNAFVFLVGTLLWSACGAVVVRLLAAPVQRQRLAEATVAGWVVWLMLACVPGSDTGVTIPGTVCAVASIPVEPGMTLRVDASVPTTAASPGMNAIDLIGIGLAIGSVLASCYLFGAWLLLRRLLQRARPVPATVHDVFASLRSPHQSRVRLLVSDLAWRPFCCGLLRPCIVLPSVMLSQPSGVNDGSLRAVLQHELAHIARGDLRGRWLFALALPLHFWNPFFWELRRQAQAAAELLADEVAATLHRDRVDYARSLIDLAELLPVAREAHVAALGVFGPATNFSKRMTMLLCRRSPLATRCSRSSSVIRSVGALTVAAAASFVWTSCAQHEEAAKPPVQTPAAPAGETAKAPVAPVPLRYEMQVQYTEEKDLDTIVTKLAQKGLITEKRGIVAAAEGKRTATLTVALPDPDLLNGLAVLLDPACIVRCTPVAGEKGGQRGAPKQAPRVFFAFEKADVGKVIDTIAKLAGANIVIAPDVQGQVTVRLQNVPWREALEVTVRQVGATVTEEDKGLLRIAKAKSTTR